MIDRFSDRRFLIRDRVVCSVLFILMGMMAASLAGFASEIGSFDRSFSVSGPVDLEVLTKSGDITVRNGAAGRPALLKRFAPSGLLAQA